VPEPPLVPSIRGTLVHLPVSSEVDKARNDGPKPIEVTNLEENPAQNSV